MTENHKNEANKNLPPRFLFLNRLWLFLDGLACFIADWRSPNENFSAGDEKEIRDYYKEVLEYSVLLDDSIKTDNTPVVQEACTAVSLIQHIFWNAIQEAEAIEIGLRHEGKQGDFFCSAFYDLFYSRAYPLYAQLATLSEKVNDEKSLALNPQAKSKEAPAKDTPPAAVEKAYQSYCWAAEQSGLESDKEVYAFLEANLSDDDYDLPAFETWQTYVSRGRKFYDTHKNTPRAGRSVRAPNATDDPDLLNQISNRFRKVDDT